MSTKEILYELRTKNDLSQEELAEKPLTEYSFQEYDELWKRAKKEV